MLWFVLRRRRRSLRPQAQLSHSMDPVQEKSGSPRVAHHSELPGGGGSHENGFLAKTPGQQDHGAPQELPSMSLRADGVRHEMQG